MCACIHVHKCFIRLSYTIHVHGVYVYSAICYHNYLALLRSSLWRRTGYMIKHCVLHLVQVSFCHAHSLYSHTHFACGHIPCSTLSSLHPGGKFFVTGGTDCLVRVYQCVPYPPVLIAELSGHTDRIMTVQFSNTPMWWEKRGSGRGRGLNYRGEGRGINYIAFLVRA